jgi:hypothetical protein
MKCLKFYVRELDAIIESILTVDKCWKEIANISDEKFSKAAELAVEYRDICYGSREAIAGLISADEPELPAAPSEDNINIDPRKFHISVAPGNDEILKKLDDAKRYNSLKIEFNECASNIENSVKTILSEYAQTKKELPGDICNALGDALYVVVERTEVILRIIEDLRYEFTSYINLD